MSIITSSSPRVGKVPHARVQLKPHQLAMVKRCRDIEDAVYRDVGKVEGGGDSKPYGVISTPVGSGKTYCAIAMCLFDKFGGKGGMFDFFLKWLGLEGPKVSGATMIVVPSHLYEQWDDAIRALAGDSLNVHRFNKYSDIACIYDEVQMKLIHESDVFLVSSLFYNAVASTLLSLNVFFRRVVFDEVDSITSVMQYITPATMTWFVSASIDRVLKADGFNAGAYRVPVNAIQRHIVNCVPSFIEAGFSLPPLNIERVPCKDVMVDGVLPSLLTSDKSRAALYACDTRTVSLIETGVADQHTSDVELAQALLEHWKRELVKADAMDDKDVQMTVKKRLAHKIATLSGALTDVSGEPQAFSKVRTVIDMCRSGKVKTIIFSEFDSVLHKLAQTFGAEGIKCADLEGGTAEKMAAAQAAYKFDPDINVIFVHSSMFCCGANLENTQRVILMHRMGEELEHQVIGRGQRPGRKEPLLLTHLEYAAESC
jgi:hypothetical protein